MRTWRKIYASLLESEQISRLSDGALILLVFLIIGQDDSGYYPWTDTKLRRLTAVRPLHTVDNLSTWRDELVTVGIARLEDGGVVLVKGEALNGWPRKDSKPELYLRSTLVAGPSQAVNSLSPDWDATGTLEQSRVEQSRVEDVAGKVSTSPAPPQIPGHFSKLAGLDGFSKSRNHSKAFENIESACAAAGVPVETVVTGFATYYNSQRFRHGWKDPVKALTQTVHIEIGKVLRPANYEHPKDTLEKLRELERGASRGRPIESI